MGTRQAEALIPVEFSALRSADASIFDPRSVTALLPVA